ncbi:endolytic transglycosylase MltG [Aliishimia ponticola]|uniref:Endolytic murein transglycosylase n=1 Tax=Aliishimia ponticola TaxID=2499833 RepID=A0A4S4NHL7_9RHOB|nr:endolytic transglycosylase MltG [Aliishimia ponticola]THH39182.1 endolytic transglycosylase MltG [Aliishimia ponticola]
MWRHVASNAVTFLVLTLFLLGGVILWGRGEYNAAGPLEDSICLQVPRGSTIQSVSRDLEAQNAIRNGAIFRMGADYQELADDLKAGSFLISEAASMSDIVATITGDGRSTCGTQVRYLVRVADLLVRVRALDPQTQGFITTAEFRPAEEEAPTAYSAALDEVGVELSVSLAPGVTSWQVVESLKAIDVLEGDIAEVPAEGALAPESYEVRPGDDRAELVAQMEELQLERISRVWAERDPDLPLETPEELMTLASIVEKETGNAEERGVVASVFVNRLRQGMRLQTDPTVIYGVTRGQGILGRGLRQSELRARTPWNTYVIEGLPPTPIANPGLASLEAVANPPDTDFVFFVAKTLDPADGHNFAVTLDEHNRNVAEYRRLEAERANSNN